MGYLIECLFLVPNLTYFLITYNVLSLIDQKEGISKKIEEIKELQGKHDDLLDQQKVIKLINYKISW